MMEFGGSKPFTLVQQEKNVSLMGTKYFQQTNSNLNKVQISLALLFGKKHC